jgi:hypothetical protein
MENLSVVPTIKKPTLQEVLTRFETWRKRKKPGSRIPKSLWAAAVDVCGVHSICEVSRALGLNYTELKRRYAAATHEAQIHQQQPTSACFVEIPALAISSTCVVEISNASGATMKMTFQGQSLHPDPVAMIRGFLTGKS